MGEMTEVPDEFKSANPQAEPLRHTPADAEAIARGKHFQGAAMMRRMTPPSPGTPVETFVPASEDLGGEATDVHNVGLVPQPGQTTEIIVPEDIKASVDRVAPGMPEMRFEPPVVTGELEKFVAEKELTPEDEAKLVAYAKVVGERSKAQIAGDWTKERQIREAQKTVHDNLTDKGKPVADEYARRYLEDIAQKEAEASAA